MLLLREDKFVKVDNKLFIVGSASNELYYYNGFAMGKINVLSWLVSADKYDVSKLEEFKPNPNINLILNDDNLSFSKKRKIIKHAVKNDDSVIAKMSLIQAIIGCHYAVKYKKILIIESASDVTSALWFHGGHIKYKLAAYPIGWLSAHYHKKADYIVYVSQMFLQNVYPSKAVAIGCPDTIMHEPKNSVLERRLTKIADESNCEEFTVGLIGATQAEYRGHDVLISAVGLLKKKGYKIKIKFLGGGTADKKRLKCAQKWGIEDNVEFCGRLPHDKVLEWIDDINALIMPTKVESLGRAAIEAMSRACPVIGTVETALREILGGDCLVHAVNYKELADKIERLIIDKKFAEYCARENFYRSFKFISDYTMNTRKGFYDMIRKVENLK